MSEFSCVIVAKSIVVRVVAKTTNPLNALGVAVDGRLKDSVLANISLGEYVIMSAALNVPLLGSIDDAS
ncbi:unnamed protein product, partial [marine sediment metagenome]